MIKILGERLNWNIELGNKKYVLKFNIKALKNIHKLTGASPFEFIDNFINEDEFNDIYLYQMLMAMSDLEITLRDLTTMVTKENRDEFKKVIITYLNKEFVSEFESEYSDNNDNEDIGEVDRLKAWINWYNYYYYVMIYQLNMSEEEFESLTIREVKTLTEHHKMFNKNILISAYIDVVKSKNKKKEAKSSNNIRLKDVLLGIAR